MREIGLQDALQLANSPSCRLARRLPQSWAWTSVHCDHGWDELGKPQTSPTLLGNEAF